MTCKDCIHYGLCETNGNAEIFVRGIENICGYFKDKSKYIELPCKVGDTVYHYDHSFVIKEIDYYGDNKILFRCGNNGTDDYMAFYNDEIGETVFLTKSEAEQKLKELQL